jgi:putative PIN family toxin of toxin-antitoxin system
MPANPHGAATGRNFTGSDGHVSFSESPLRVVLDTNVLLSLTVFSDSRLAAMSEELATGRWLALTSAACLAEFRRVLGYPKFALSDADQQQIFDAYAGMATCIGIAAEIGPSLPLCSDPDDQKFLELARDGTAVYLISADRALLKLARRKRLDHLFRIVAPDAAVALIIQ